MCIRDSMRAQLYVGRFWCIECDGDAAGMLAIMLRSSCGQLALHALIDLVGVAVALCRISAQVLRMLRRRQTKLALSQCRSICRLSYEVIGCCTLDLQRSHLQALLLRPA